MGRVVGGRAGERLIGFSLELGGKNPMVVLADADLDAAARGAVRGSFANTGQLCISFERLYVQASIAEALPRALHRGDPQLAIGIGSGLQRGHRVADVP